MKIGLSFSRCVRDLVKILVNIDDVLVIISRTNFDPTIESEWYSIWSGYNGNSPWSLPEWSGLDHDQTKEVVLNLWNRGLIHQPRKFGGNPQRRAEYWLEAVLVDTDLSKNPAAKNAWEQFQVVAGLSNVILDKEYK